MKFLHSMIKIYRCVKSDWRSQGFYDNLACIAADADGNAIFPMRVLRGIYPNSCPINSIKLYPVLGMKYHGGYDRAVYYREPGYFDTEADFNGEPIKWNQYIEIDSAGGLGVDVVSDRAFVPCEGCPEGTLHFVKRRYWHNASAIVNGEEWDFDRCKRAIGGLERVKVTDNIALGQKIFLSDSTGLSGGNHVHDAFKWCDENGDGIHSDNGTYGTFDFAKWYENVFVLDALHVKQEALTAIELARKVIFQVIAFLNRSVGSIIKKVGLGVPIENIKQKMEKLNGLKTYLGLGVALLGVLGFGGLISEDEAGRSYDLVIELVGIVFAVYGRFVARPK